MHPRSCRTIRPRLPASTCCRINHVPRAQAGKRSVASTTWTSRTTLVLTSDTLADVAIVSDWGCDECASTASTCPTLRARSSTHSAGRPEGVSPFDTISQRSTSGDDEGSIGSTTCSTWPSRPSGFTDFPSPTCSPRSSGWEWGSSSNRSHRSAVHIARRQTRTRFACEYDGAPEPGDLVAPGSATQFKYVNFLDALHRD